VKVISGELRLDVTSVFGVFNPDTEVSTIRKAFRTSIARFRAISADTCRTDDGRAMTQWALNSFRVASESRLKLSEARLQRFHVR
jgi:hypothetical protein